MKFTLDARCVDRRSCTEHNECMYVGCDSNKPVRFRPEASPELRPKVLLAALLWLRNHYELKDELRKANKSAPDLEKAVLARIDWLIDSQGGLDSTAYREFLETVKLTELPKAGVPDGQIAAELKLSGQRSEGRRQGKSRPR